MLAFLWIVITLLSITIAVLAVKILTLQRAAREITVAFSERLSTDTNTLIGISSRDKHMLALASGINEQLRLLRDQRRRYLHGDKELKDAVTGLSHDLRTPLTAIYGYLELLKKEEKSENVTRYLAFIENRTEAMRQLTEELFRYSVILSTQNVTPEAVDVGAMLEESLASFYGAFVERGIEPRITFPDARVVRVLDKGALSRILGNVLSNALKYSEGDLAITLTDGGTLSFTNRAPGLDEVQVGRLFDRFFTVESARNSTGLGLAIAKTLAERIGGRISAQYEQAQLTILLQL
ncbi:MAG: HAMP domain-containing histidine kinase [Ruminococcaceae bacterium]|nr:HAMP domain-containing histidine kinase [Oscillospiraceae bacterium]